MAHWMKDNGSGESSVGLVWESYLCVLIDLILTRYMEIFSSWKVIILPPIYVDICMKMSLAQWSSTILLPSDSGIPAVS